MITVDKGRELKNLKKLILNHEDWLMQRVLQYARERNYVKYTSTLAEAWRISVANLSNAIVTAIEVHDQPPELGPDDDYTQDPIASFGVQEAQKHRARGLTIGVRRESVLYDCSAQKCVSNLLFHQQYPKRCCGKVTNRIKPANNVSRTRKSAARTVRRRQVCQRQGG